MTCNEKLKIHFAKFLRKNKVLEKFCCYHIKQSTNVHIPENLPVVEKTNMVLEDCINKLVERKSDPLYIFVYYNTSFAWGLTEEGGTFWSNIDSKWKNYYKNEIRNEIMWNV